MKVDSGRGHRQKDRNRYNRFHPFPTKSFFSDYKKPEKIMGLSRKGSIDWLVILYSVLIGTMYEKSVFRPIITFGEFDKPDVSNALFGETPPRDHRDFSGEPIRHATQMIGGKLRN